MISLPILNKTRAVLTGLLLTIGLSTLAQQPATNNLYPFLKQRIDSSLANATAQKSITPKDIREVTTRLAAAIQYMADTRSAINIRDLGALPGAAASINAPAIQRAEDMATSLNASVYYPDGTYDIGGATIAVKGRDSRRLADGAKLTYSGTGSAYKITDSYHLNVFGLTIIGTNYNGTGIEFENSSGVSLVECGLINLGRGVYSESASSLVVPGPNRIADCFANKCVRGFDIESFSEYIQITGNHIYGCTEHGIYETAGNFNITNNLVVDCNNGITVSGFDGTTGNSDHSSIANNTINHCWSNGLRVENTSYSMSLDGNIIYATIGQNGNNTGFVGYDQTFGILLRNTKNVSVTGGTLGHNRCNLGVDGAVATTVTGVTFKTDPTRTQSNYREFGANKSGVNLNTANSFVGNTFEGVCTNGRAATFDFLTDGRSQNYKIVGNSSTVSAGFLVLSGGVPGGYNFTGEQSLTIRSDYTGAVEINPVLFQNSFSISYDQVSNDGSAYWVLARAGTVTSSTPYATVSTVTGGTSIKLSGEATYTFTPTGYSSWNITATAQPQPIRAPALQNNWVAYSTDATQPGYWKDQEGNVHYQGLYKGGAVGSVLFTLPAGFRPAKRSFQPILATGAPGMLQIEANGLVILAAASDPSWLSLDGVLIRTDN